MLWSLLAKANTGNVRYRSQFDICWSQCLLLQVFEVATDSGADDIVPATDEDDRLEGYKVRSLL